MSEDRFARDIGRGLSRAYDASSTELETVDLETTRLVIFSDHHKGARDGADDFRRCEPAYNAALAHYFERGHRLFVLGDVEELWECRPAEVLPAYAHTFALERAFHDAGRYERFFGNHDDAWRAESTVKRHLDPLFPGVRVREALHLELTAAGTPVGRLFLAHGHQGTADSDRFGWFSRLVVHYVWRPLQRRLNIASTSPAADWDLRERHETAMFEWARAHPDRPVLITGHTHRPIFWTSVPKEDAAVRIDQLRADVEQERQASEPDRQRLSSLRAELEYALAEQRRHSGAARPLDPPCYFNTGCCSFGDGDITGLEIADGEIRLVHWPDADDQPAPRTLAHERLETVLVAVSPAAGAAG